MIKHIRHITAIKILEEYQTEGSGPLKVIGDDDELYVAKFTTYRHPYKELINELICGLLAQCWGLKVPEMVVIGFSGEVVERFTYSDRYHPAHFQQEFFGSHLLENVQETEIYFGHLNKKEYGRFENPLDFILTGCFDHWVGNRDRKPDNSNMLISIDANEKLQWHPIDHAAAFAYLDYREVRDAMVRIENSILKCGFVRSIGKYEDKKKLENLPKIVEICISNSLKEIDHIFDQVPKSWGFGKKSRAKLKEFFNNEERNQRITTIFQQHLK